MSDITTLMMGAAGQVGGDYQISRSLRFNSADSAYLSRTPASAGSRTTWTWSGWVKRGLLGGDRVLFGAWNGADRAAIKFENDNKIQYYEFVGGSVPVNIASTALFRDLSGWYHVVITANTDSSAITIYVNNNAVVNGSVSAGYTTFINQAIAHGIGTETNGTYDGLMADINFIDGQALTPSSFGETDETTGVWKPIRYAGTYGTNGFHLDFSDNSSTTALGYDAAGSNDWTPNNFSVTAGAGNDSLVDTPTPYGTDTGAGGEVRGNYATLNPLKNGPSNTLSNGNLTIVNSASVTNLSFSTIVLPKSGKWYFEALVSANAGTTAAQLGIFSTNQEVTNTGSKRYWYLESGFLFEDSTQLQTVSSYTAGDLIACAYNADANTVTWYKNNVQQGTAVSVSTSYEYCFGVGLFKGQWDVNFGQRPFAYTAPSGFKALVTTNLPDPTIVQGDDYFNTVLYTGTGAAGNAVTGVGFQPDFNWIKCRSTSSNHLLTDAVRGIGKSLFTNLTEAESTTRYITSLNSDGFTVGVPTDDINESGRTFVAWNWKANGSGVSNTAGTITSTVSANTTSGFSIVTWTGTGANATVGHGLGAAPRMIIVKNRDATDAWQVYHAANTANPETDYLVLNTTAATADAADRWNDTLPTSTVFSIGNGVEVNTNTEDYVAYCFAEVEGFSKFGSYTGNGSADGPFVYTGFRPAWIMVKQSSASGEHWVILDNQRNLFNVQNRELYANLTNVEGANGGNATLDFLSNGFKIRTTNAGQNTSSATYVYACFASNPFKTSLAR
jgi:hypothetical protein